MISIEESMINLIPNQSWSEMGWTKSFKRRISVQLDLVMQDKIQRIYGENK